MRIVSVAIILLSLFGFSLTGMAGHQIRVLDIRTLASPANVAHVVLDVSEPTQYTLFTLDQAEGKPHRVVLDLHNTRLVGNFTAPVNHPLISAIRSGERKQGQDTRIVIDLKQAANARVLVIKPAGRYGHRIALNLEIPGQPNTSPAQSPTTARIVQLAAPQAAIAPSAPPRLTMLNPLPKAAPSVAYAPPQQPKPAPIVAYAPPQQSLAAAPVYQAAAPVYRAPPQAAASASLPQAVSHAGGKRKLIVAIDAGHGGIDPGATGSQGTQEKVVTLAIAKRLAQLVNQQQGMQAVLIRDSDYFLSLRQRIDRAREFKADVFLSLHADSYQDNSNIQGSSIYMLSQRGASSEAAKWLAERENGSDLLGGANTVSLKDKSDVLASILLDLSQTGTLEASSQLAGELLGGLAQVGPVNHKNVQQAAFQVLKSPDIPSVLVEMAFISNPHEERKLNSATEQRKLAQALLNGLKTYFRRYAPPGTLLARQGF